MSLTSTGTTRPRLRRLLRIVTGIGIEDREAEEVAAEAEDAVVAAGAARTTDAAEAATEAEDGTKEHVADTGQLLGWLLSLAHQEEEARSQERALSIRAERIEPGKK